MQNVEQIKEDILIVGGGPVGGMLAHIIATKHQASVRVIERYPDLNDPSVVFDDRSGNLTVSYKTQNLYYKYGLKQEFNAITNPTEYFSIIMHDFMIQNSFMPQSRVHNFTAARRDFSALLTKKNQANPNITYEYNTKVLNVDLQNKQIETLNRDTNEQTKRSFNIILGADGYNSQVRNAIDRINNTTTRVEEYPYACKNCFMPNYANYLLLQDQVKEGKYPLYEKLDEKFKKRKGLYGKYLMDPSHIYGYGSQNLWVLLVPLADGTFNLCICMGNDENSYKNFIAQHPQYKDTIKFTLDESFNFNFSKLQTDEQIHDFLAEHIPQYYGLMPDLIEQFKKATAHKAQTVFAENWFHESDACIFGDACNGMTYMTANGHNVSMENLDVFFTILEEKTKNNFQSFLTNPELRQEIFSHYQNTQFKNARACQEGDIKDAVFPSLTQAQHPKSMLFHAVEAELVKIMPDMFTTKLNLCFFTTHSFYDAQTKGHLFIDYIVGKIEKAEKLEDVDLTNAKQEITDLLNKQNLPLTFTINPTSILA